MIDVNRVPLKRGNRQGRNILSGTGYGKGNKSDNGRYFGLIHSNELALSLARGRTSTIGVINSGLDHYGSTNPVANSQPNISLSKDIKQFGSAFVCLRSGVLISA